MNKDIFNCKRSFSCQGSTYEYYSLKALEEKGLGKVSSLPFSIRVLLEQAVRNFDGFKVTQKHIKALAAWDKNQNNEEIPYMPTRVVLQDFTGVPTLVDLASLRSSMKSMQGDPKVINPQTPVALVVDHSVQIDKYGSQNALEKNMAIEFRRNEERYKFLKWGQKAFDNFKVIPPGAGIIHQVNLEFLASVIQEKNGAVFPDTVIGTDSHTTMISGIGVLGWGVGGIEAESVMLGQPIYMKIPDVIGFKLVGKPKENITATDIVLKVTQMLREKGVVEKFVEFYGEGLNGLSLADRATIANMAPEYGATVGFFPVDAETLNYMRKTGREESLIEKVKAYYQSQDMFRENDTPDPEFTDTLELDLGNVVPSLAGPKRPQDRINLSDMKTNWNEGLTKDISKGGFGLTHEKLATKSLVAGSENYLEHGSILIAAITSCTNTSNPAVLMAAGLLAKKAHEKGLSSKPWVKTSLAPGSRVVTTFLEKAGLQEHLNALGFYTAGYGCTTCIGNSGPLAGAIVDAIQQNTLITASVLSGNRNFEGRIHGDVKANFLASPPLVVAYAIAGNVNIDLNNEPLGKDQNEKPIFLSDIWPSAQEIQDALSCITPDMYKKSYSNIENISEKWNSLDSTDSEIYAWDEKSSYVQNPPFFQDMSREIKSITTFNNARVLVKLGDSVTTDHISPAGAFAESTPAGKFLKAQGINKADFNSYGSRRGNDKIMTRGTFANVRLRNQLLPGVEGGFTKYIPSQEEMTIFEASEKYKETNTPLIVLAGKEYGTGSSRDWAAKGTYLLGVKAVIAQSYERIHRSNLIGMGVLPLQFMAGESHESLGLTGEEEYSIIGLDDNIIPGATLTLKCGQREISVLSRLDTPVDIEYYRNGGILHTVLRNFMKNVS